MRIHSDFKDYYDGANGFDPDDTLHYNRKTQELVFNRSKKHEHSLEEWKLIEDLRSYIQLNQDPSNICHPIVVGFCGKLYITLSDSKTPNEHLTKRLNDQFCYNKQEVKRLLEDRPKHSWQSKPEKFAFNNRGWEEQKALINGKEDLSIFLHYWVPIYTLHIKYNDRILTLNPPLRNIFPHIIDPFTAVQELEMFLGSTLARQIDPSDNISDEIRRDYAGFDKTSFRNIAPGAKKTRRASRNS